jgi:hypothetical protein
VLIADIAAARFRWATEDDLQRGLAEALAAKGHVVEREIRLNARDRIDLLVDRVGIEVKTAGATRDVERQLLRYLESDLIDELVLVTAKAMHRRIPQGAVGRKHLFVHQLQASAL